MPEKCHKCLTEILFEIKMIEYYLPNIASGVSPKVATDIEHRLAAIRGFAKHMHDTEVQALTYQEAGHDVGPSSPDDPEVSGTE